MPAEYVNPDNKNNALYPSCCGYSVIGSYCIVVGLDNYVYRGMHLRLMDVMQETQLLLILDYRCVRRAQRALRSCGVI